KQRKDERFTSLLHHVDVQHLTEAYYAIKHKAAPGVDGVTWKEYGEHDLELKLADLHARIHRGAYRALPARRQFIPKADGTQRPLAIAVLEAIYEQDFLGFSYGFRPKRGAHDAMDALIVGIEQRKVNWILDLDIRSF